MKAHYYSGFIILQLREKSFGEFAPLGSVLEVDGVSQALKHAEITSVSRRISSVPPAQLVKLERAPVSDNSLPSLTSFWRLDGRHLKNPKSLLETLNRLDNVVRAYREVRAANPRVPQVNPVDDPLFPKQIYLGQAPDGIEAVWAWSRRGGDGSNVRFIDLEEGWKIPHEDLPRIHKLRGVPSQINPCTGHGTPVLGVVVGVDNDKGIVGIAPGAFAALASHWRAPSSTIDMTQLDQFCDLPQDNGHVADTISSLFPLLADSTLSPGDVLLLEVMKPFWVDRWRYLPTEVDPDDFLAIVRATEHGLVVVEAAGNSDTDLDDLPFPISRKRPGDFKDSGTIMVAAGNRHKQRYVPSSSNWGSSNWGSRVDCFALGEGVVSTSSSGRYTVNFNGTSAAAAIVAGAAVLLQSIYKAATPGAFLTSKQMRDVLSRTGTPSRESAAVHIGRMPDLKRAASVLRI